MERIKTIAFRGGNDLIVNKQTGILKMKIKSK